MKPEDRRRLGAVAALVAGVFVGLTLIHAVPTGPLGRLLGESLWRLLGGGAVGLPVLGLGLAFAGGGVGRLPQLAMKRDAILLGGLPVLVPFTIGVVTNVPAQAFDPPLADWDLAARLTGILPGFAARYVTEGIGQPGGLLLAFLVLSALTLATLAWHPLHRLEKKAGGPADGGVLPAPAPGPDEDENGAPRTLPRPLRHRPPRPTPLSWTRWDRRCSNPSRRLRSKAAGSPGGPAGRWSPSSRSSLGRGSRRGASSASPTTSPSQIGRA